ncbi:MAG: hypothetical protein RR988_05435 [Clostridia bacterium]
MNKKQLLNLVNSLNLPKTEYYILGGGSLVISNIKETTADLDLCVSNELFTTLKEKYNLKESDKNPCGFYPLNDLVEIVPNTKENFTMQEIDGYNVENLERILKFKKNRNLPKDLNDIINIEKYLDTHK